MPIPQTEEREGLLIGAATPFRERLDVVWLAVEVEGRWSWQTAAQESEAGPGPENGARP